jgi:hypothetical protein
MLRDTAGSAPAQAPGVSQLLDLVFVTLVVAPTMAAQELHYRLASRILVLFLESFLVLYLMIFDMQCKLNAMQAKETAGQVGLTHAPSGPLSFSATASQCEAAGAGAHRKMSAVLKLDSNGAPLTIAPPNNKEDSNRVDGHESSEATVSIFQIQVFAYHLDTHMIIPCSALNLSFNRVAVLSSPKMRSLVYYSMFGAVKFHGTLLNCVCFNIHGSLICG